MCVCVRACARVCVVEPPPLSPLSLSVHPRVFAFFLLAVFLPALAGRSLSLSLSLSPTLSRSLLACVSVCVGVVASCFLLFLFEK